MGCPILAHSVESPNPPVPLVDTPRIDWALIIGLFCRIFCLVCGKWVPVDVEDLVVIGISSLLSSSVPQINTHAHTHTHTNV